MQINGGGWHVAFWMAAAHSDVDYGPGVRRAVEAGTTRAGRLDFTSANAVGYGGLRRTGWRHRGRLRSVGGGCSVRAGTGRGGAWHRRRLLEAAGWWTVLICIALAVIWDIRAGRRGKQLEPVVRLAMERNGSSAGAALLNFALLRLSWTPVVALDYARRRRALLYSASHPRTRSEQLPALRELVTGQTGRMDAASSEAAWRGIGGRQVWQRIRARSGRWPWWERVLLVVGALLLVPAGVLTDHHIHGLARPRNSHLGARRLGTHPPHPDHPLHPRSRHPTVRDRHPLPRDRHRPHRHPHPPRRRIRPHRLACPRHPLGHHHLEPRRHRLHPTPLPRPIPRPGNRPPLQPPPTLRPRNSPLPHPGPTGPDAGAQPGCIRPQPAYPGRSAGARAWLPSRWWSKRRPPGSGVRRLL